MKKQGYTNSNVPQTQTALLKPANGQKSSSTGETPDSGAHLCLPRLAATWAPWPRGWQGEHQQEMPVLLLVSAGAEHTATLQPLQGVPRPPPLLWGSKSSSMG